MRRLQITYSLIILAKYLVLIGSLLSIFFFLFIPAQQNKFVDIPNFQNHLGNIYWEIKSNEISEVLREQLPYPNEPMLLSVDRIGIALPLTVGYKVMTIGFVIVYGIYVFVLLHMIGQIVNRIKSGDYFNRLNTQQLKQIGLLVTAAPFIESLISSGYMTWIGLRYHIEGMSLHSEGHLGTPVVILGLLILALATAFDQGVKMKEEQELTI